eukprot:m51a1_g6765 hypothetical protein (529) ;mRNA; r:99994-101816
MPGQRRRRRVANETDEERAQRLEAEAMREEETRKRKEEQMRAALHARREEDAAFSKLNSTQLDEAWRKVLRRAKLAELRSDVDVLSQTFDHEIDRKDAYISQLERDLDDMEEQYQMALRTHIANLERLEEIHEVAQKGRERTFHDAVDHLRAEYGGERREVVESQKSRESELRAVIRAMEEDFKQKEVSGRQHFASTLQEQKERSTDDIGAVRESLDLKIDALQGSFEAANKEYQREIGPVLEEFKKAHDQDQQKEKEIAAAERKLVRLQESLTAWRVKLGTSVREHEEAQTRLREEKEIAAAHYAQLKMRMARVRDMQRERLLELTRLANAATKGLEERLSLAERVLRASEVADKLKTEQERVLPFQTLNQAVPLPPSEASAKVAAEVAAEVAKAESEQEQIIAPPPREDELYSCKGVDKEGRRVDETQCLENFFKLYNRALLDTETLQRDQESLVKENIDLRAIIREYEEGRTIIDNTPALGTLMIINERVPPRIRVVEGEASNMDRATHIVHMQAGGGGTAERVV